MKLSRQLVGKIRQKEFDRLRPERLAPCDRTDIVDVLAAIRPDTPERDKLEVLRMAEGVASDIVQGYSEDNTMTPDELRNGQALVRAAMKR